MSSTNWIMNKAFELEHLRNLLMNPELPCVLYLLDMDLTDEEIEGHIKELGCCSYMKETLFSPSRGGSAFELFVVGLSHQCAGNIEISNLRNLLFTSDGAGKDNIIYSLLIQMMKHLCMNGRTIIHVYGELDLTTLTHEDLYKLKESLTHHKDVIIVASVSCIYSLGDPIDYRNMVISLRPGMIKERDELLRKLVENQYERNEIEFTRSKFRVKGDVVEVFPAGYEDKAIRIEFWGDEIEKICEFDPLTGKTISTLTHTLIHPASHYVTSGEKMKKAIKSIEAELEVCVK